ncbi:MAG: ATP-binding protein [Acidimicrobiales bacterium]
MDLITTEPGEVDEGRLLLELTRDVTSSLDLQDVLDKSLAALRRLIDFDGGSIQLIFDDHLRMVAGDPQPPPEAMAFRLPLGAGFGGRVATTGEPIYSADATTDPRAHPEGRRKASLAGTHSWFGAPLIVHGETIGIVQLDDAQVDHFPPRVQARILSFLPIVSAAVQNAQLFGREREAVNKLTEAERLKQDLVATVSHELRTPLTIVQGFATMLADGSITSEHAELTAVGRGIRDAARRLQVMITDLLHISGIETGTLVTEVDDTDVVVVVRNAVSSSDRGTHVVEVVVGPDVPMVRTDRSRLVELLAKLVDNAQKFSEAGSTITVGLGVDGPDVAVSVADNGIGIPAAMLDRVFEPFVQVDSSRTRSVGGMGTGLFLVRRIGSAIGVTVSVESEEGVGSTFTLRVPAVDGPPLAAGSTPG